jgi:hypothetical protein
MSDLLCREDRTARLRQVIKKTIDNTVVAFVRKALVFGPNMVSTLEKLSTSPPPRPCWTKTIAINNRHTVT